jgi:hypothetical protein
VAIVFGASLLPRAPHALPPRMLHASALRAAARYCFSARYPPRVSLTPRVTAADAAAARPVAATVCQKTSPCKTAAAPPIADMHDADSYDAQLDVVRSLKAAGAAPERVKAAAARLGELKRASQVPRFTASRKVARKNPPPPPADADAEQSSLGQATAPATTATIATTAASAPRRQAPTGPTAASAPRRQAPKGPKGPRLQCPSCQQTIKAAHPAGLHKLHADP